MPFTRRRLQFTLRGVLLVLTLVGVWLGSSLERLRRKAEAIAAIERLGGSLEFDYRLNRTGYHANARPPGPKWLKRILGEHFAANPVRVQAGGIRNGRSTDPAAFTDAVAEHIGVLTELDWLMLSGTRITDKGLMHFKGLHKLGRLDLEEAPVTRAGVEELHRFLPQATIYFTEPDGDGYLPASR